MSDTPEVQVSADTSSRPQAQNKSRFGRRIMGLVLAVLIILMLAGSYLLYRLIAVPTSGDGESDGGTAGVTWVRSIYGMSDAAKDQLERAQAAVTAPDGTIWVTDGAHRKLMHFAADGRYLGEMAGPKDSPLDQPGRFTIGPDGKFYITETSGDAIIVLNQNNQNDGSFKIPKPVSVAVSEDRIVVGAISGFAILDKTGKPLKVIGSRGKGDDQFDYVHGVAIGENGNIYVSDSYNNRISAYDKNGKRLWIVRTGKPANQAKFTGNALTTQDTKDIDVPEDKQLQLPLGLTLDGAGRIVVVDMFDSTLAVLDPKDGKVIGRYGELGPDDGEFFYPTSISYDAQRDWFTVADALNNRVEIIRLPDSAAGNQAVAAARRAMTGPLRACLFPLLLILIAFVVYVISRVLGRRKRQGVEQEQTEAPAVVVPPTE